MTVDEKIDVLFEEVKRAGSVEVSKGVLLCTAEIMTEEQKTWDDGDGEKHTDFSTSEFWFWTDNGFVEPAKKEDIAEYLN